MAKSKSKKQKIAKAVKRGTSRKSKPRRISRPSRKAKPKKRKAKTAPRKNRAVPKKKSGGAKTRRTKPKPKPVKRVKRRARNSTDIVRTEIKSLQRGKDRKRKAKGAKVGKQFTVAKRHIKFGRRIKLDPRKNIENQLLKLQSRIDGPAKKFFDDFQDSEQKFIFGFDTSLYFDDRGFNSYGYQVPRAIIKDREFIDDQLEFLLETLHGALEGYLARKSSGFYVNGFFAEVVLDEGKVKTPESFCKKCGEFSDINYKKCPACGAFKSGKNKG